MKCLFCDKETDFLTCGDHAPEHGDIITCRYPIPGTNTVIGPILGKDVIYYGKMPLWSAITNRLLGSNVIRWWTGTDARTLVEYPPGKAIWKVRLFLHRIKARLIERFTHKHWYGCETVKSELLRFGISEDKMFYKPYPPKHAVKYKRKKHQNFNIIVQVPQPGSNLKYKKWVLGYDIYKQAREIIAGTFDVTPHVRWIELDGTKDMAEIYPITNAYIFCKRYNNPQSRIMMECEINNIPFIVSQSSLEIAQWIIYNVRKWRKW